MDFVWYRTIRALDRLEMEDISLDKKHGKISFTMPAYDGQPAGDESSGSGWLSGLFGGDADEKKSSKAEKFVLVLAEQPGYVNFTLLDSRGMEASNATAAQLRAALAMALE